VEPDSINEGVVVLLRRAKVLSELLEGHSDHTGGLVYLELGWLDANFEIHQVFGFFTKFSFLRFLRFFILFIDLFYF
jgi:hypothetical protein